MANKNTLGKKAIVEGYSKIGIITKTNTFGEPIEVTIDGEIIEVVNLAVKLVSLVKQIISFFKSIFKK